MVVMGECGGGGTFLRMEERAFKQSVDIRIKDKSMHREDIEPVRLT